MEVIGSTHRRIERARHQYEDLLIHAGNVLLDEPITGESEYDSDERDFSSPPPSPQASEGSSIYSTGSRSVKTDKDIIALLQSENDRLRLKVDSTINYASDMVQAAQLSQSSMMNTLSTQDCALTRKNAALIEENQQLNVILQLTQKELHSEREKLLKATRFMERLKTRGRITKSNGSIRRDSGGSLNVQPAGETYATSSFSSPTNFNYSPRRNSASRPNSPNGTRSPRASLSGSGSKKLATRGFTQNRHLDVTNTIGSLSQSPYKSPYKSPSTPSPFKSPYKSPLRHL